ncbi:MAG: argininosuccinate synthase [Rhodocyclaceae bacterium]|jgi:argininosuccinate synthase|nr:argininosuccinate synthase [Rhodocyclaceae bacterium]MBK6906817.1 argininosuccinate synthase [Rhodocyclaceae bacterium]
MATSKASKKTGEKKIKRVVLAYSGGLDTSVILKWLQDTYQCEVVTFTADLGQGEELEPARAKAIKMGIKPEHIFIDDLREEFVRDFVFPMFRANTIYEGEYLLGTSIARPLIAKRLVEIARKVGADTISHGATGKGNDQVRFELGAYALMPNVKVIAPWREWDLLSREKLMAYAETHGIPIDMKHKKGGSPYSMDANLLHISFEGRHLEDPAAEAEESMWRWTVSPEKAPNAAEYIDIEFKQGDPVAINGQKMSPAKLLATLNTLGGKHGIGRLDLVENRYVGMKSRGCYETPGGTILLKAHRAIESICLDREVAHLKDDLMPRYASLIYNGYWWAPERKALQALIDHTQGNVNGWVRIKLYKGNVIVVGRDSKTDSLFDPTIATFEDDAGAYDQKDAHGFIRLNALRMRIAGNRVSISTDNKAATKQATGKKAAAKK